MIFLQYIIVKTKMKLVLKDFKCHSNSTFDFGENGLTLLSGNSGSGKSSILQGILFGLLGDGMKVQAYGKLSCRVELTLKDLTIVRSKRPNRLLVNEVFEDEAGQTFITELIGHTFRTTGYVAQSSSNSFILMSPIDKLDFIEKFVFKDTNLSQLKTNCKQLINSQNTAFISAQAKLEMATNLFKSLIEPIEVKFPIKCKNKDLANRNEHIRLKNAINRVKKSKDKIQKLHQEIADIRVLEATVKERQDQIDSCNNKLQTIRETIKSTLFCGDEQLRNLKSQLEAIISRESLIQAQRKYELDCQHLIEMEEAELKLLTDSFENLTSNPLSNEYMSVEEIDDELTGLNTLYKLYTVLGPLIQTEQNLRIKLPGNETIENLTKACTLQEELLSESLLQKRIYSCPSCNTKVCIKNDALTTVNLQLGTVENVSEIKDKISSLKDALFVAKQLQDVTTQITKIKKAIKDISDEEMSADSLHRDISELNTLRSEMEKRTKAIQTTKNAIENKIFSVSITKYKSSLTKRKDDLDKMREEHGEDLEVSMTEGQLRDIINKEESTKTMLDTLNETVVNTEREIKCHDGKIRTMNITHNAKYGRVCLLHIINEEIQVESKAIESSEKDILKHTDNIKQMELYAKYVEDSGRYVKNKTDIQYYESLVSELQNKYSASMQLKEKIMEAESLAMTQVIESINAYAQTYLNDFFPDNPIVVRLCTFKEVKTVKKPQITVEVEYKGNETDIGSLSGGETARVVIAFTLALAEMCNTPLVMLDEITASLDEELSMVVFDSIRENFKNKLVLVVAHQTVSGSFDRVINL